MVGGVLAALSLFTAVWLGERYKVWQHVAYDPGTLAGRRTLVVGASSGIGREMVLYLAKHGAHVTAVARRRADLTSIAAQHPDRITFLVADAGNATDVERIAAAGTDFDYVFLNHAFFASYNSAETPNDSEVRRLFEINFFSYVGLASRLIPTLDKHGGVLTVSSSAAGLVGTPLQGAYSASKHALHGYFGALQNDLLLAGSNVSITVAVIGSVDVERRAKDVDDTYYGRIPMLSADEAASGIIAGAVQRLDVVDVPKMEIGSLRLGLLLAPSTTRAAMRKIAAGHACTQYGPQMAMVLCFFPF